jgi:hypothetical protein
MITYEIFENTRGEELVRKINQDGSIWEFSKNPANSDYQRYLRWLENPNELEHLTEIPTE